MNRRSVFASFLILIMLGLVGCSGVTEVQVPPTNATFDKAVDLSIYKVEDKVTEEKQAVPLDPKLNYIDTETFTRLMASVKPTTNRSSYDQAPPEWDFVLVDARPSKVYNEGHINGAINIPDSQFDQYKGLLPEDKDQLVVFYCGGLACPLSKNSALKAQELGYTNIKVYQEGTPAWQSAGNYLTVTSEYVKGLIMETYVSRVDYAPFLIIDTRPYNMYFDEHIPNAINMEDTAFSQKYLASVPQDKNIEIVLYCGGFT